MLPPKHKSFFNQIFSLTCSQIWLSPLVDDHQSTYLTKLRIKNLGKKNTTQGFVHFQIFKNQEPEVIIQQIE
jgi:hypothetical protein